MFQNRRPSVIVSVLSRRNGIVEIVDNTIEENSRGVVDSFLVGSNIFWLLRTVYGIAIQLSSSVA